MPLPVIAASEDIASQRRLAIDPEFVARFLVEFLVQECKVRRRMTDFSLGVSGGVDSAVTAYLAARAFGAEHVHAFRLPYKVSSQESLDHAQLVINDLGLPARTIDITPMVDGYLAQESDATPTRIGNVCARARMIILFDQAAEVGGLPLGTGNKTERFFGYFTWHGDDAPPINPLGDLFKAQVWELAKFLGVPDVIVNKAPTADLIKGQTDEGDFGISYPDADGILCLLAAGFSRDMIVAQGWPAAKVDLVIKKVASTHWKRQLSTVAMVSDTAINEYYLRPVDY